MMNGKEQLVESLKSLVLPEKWGILSIEVDLDTFEYLDEQASLDILVGFSDGKEHYQVISYHFLLKVINKCKSDNKEVQTFGKPLLIVSQVTADTILLALQRHLQQEDFSYGTGAYRRPAVPRVLTEA